MRTRHPVSPRTRRIAGVTSLAAVSALLLGTATASAQDAGSNLVTNPGAEAVTGSDANYADIPVTGWSPETGAFTAVKYGSGEFPSIAVANAVGGGKNFFTGGAAAVSSGQQRIDLQAYAATIATGTAPYTLSAYLGGFADQQDHAQVDAQFLGAGDAVLGTATLTPVTAAERSNTTNLLPRSASGTVPVGTLAVRVVLTLTRSTGTSNDGYADNIVFSLNAPSTGQPRVRIGPAKVVAKPAPKPVVKTTKPVPTPTGGALIKVTPTTTCATMTATSTFTRPATAAGAKTAKAKAQSMYIGGFGTSTAKLRGGGTVLLPRQVVTAVIPGQQVTFNVQPIVVPKTPTAKVVDPPPTRIATTVSCTPPRSTTALKPVLGLGGSPTAASNAFGSLVPQFTAGIARPAKPASTTTAVNPRPTTPSTPAQPVTLVPGVWSGKVSGTVAAGSATAPAGQVSFTVDENGRVSRFVLRGAERCVTPAGSRQGGSVTSTPWFTTIALNRTITLSPANGFPKRGFATYASSARFGTKSIKLGTSIGAPGLTAHSKDSITGTVTALRTEQFPGNPNATVSCSLTASFSAKPGGATVSPADRGYTDD